MWCIAASLTRELALDLRAPFEANGWFVSERAQRSCRNQLVGYQAVDPDGHDPWVFCAEVGMAPGQLTRVSSHGARLAAPGTWARLRIPGFIEGFLIGTASRLMVVSPRSRLPWVRDLSALSGYSLDPGKLTKVLIPTFNIWFGSEQVSVEWRVPHSTLGTAIALMVYSGLFFVATSPGGGVWESTLDRYVERRGAAKRALFGGFAHYVEAAMALG
jgi:hypothetical protein